MATPSLTEARLPERGDVIEFAFLWKHERDSGLLEGVKDRRCVILSILEGGRRVVIAPITGTEPQHNNKIALAGGRLGLARPSWIVTSELNVTIWPGHDLRHALTPSGAWWRYGRLSDDLRTKLAAATQVLITSGRANVVPRT